MDEKYIECAEQTTQDNIDRRVKLIQRAAEKLDVRGSGSCVVCGEPAKKALFKGELIFTRFCGKKCQDKFGVK